MDVALSQVPTLVLLTVLMAVFGALWLQGRRSQAGQRSDGDAPTVRLRKLLWLAGWAFCVLRLVIEASGHGASGWGLAAAQSCMEIVPLMFLASLAPQYLIHRPRIPFVVAFGVPLVAFTVLVSVDPQPGLPVRVLLALCLFTAIAIAAAWSLRKNLVPVWLSLLIVGLVGAGCIVVMAQQQYQRVLMLAHSGILLMTAYLFVSAFRRLTAGVVFTSGGLAVWALPAVILTIYNRPASSPALGHLLNLVRVITAVGMVVLVLEDEVAFNLAGRQRDRRARLEMEKYTELHLAPISFDEDKREYEKVCSTIAGVSRFHQAAIFLRSADGTFRLTAQAGMEGALEGALDALARRTNEEKARAAATEKYFSKQIGSLILGDLTPLMEPGDELKQMNFRKVWLIGLRTRDGQLQGALLLAGLRNPEEPLLTEDVLPLELLVARMAAAREHQGLVRRLIRSERLTGLGQLAGGVAHELNNPLTVVTGYAELLAESGSAATRDAAGVILNEARRMKQIIESLMRFQRAEPEPRAAVSVGLLLEDIEKLVRPELETAHVEMQLRVPEGLPRVRADGEQMRQVFLQVIKNAIGSLEETPEGAERRLLVEAAAIGGNVQVMFSDTGPGFADTARAFDPFYTTRHPGEGVGLGLSVCYSIIREHGGEISAVNLDPHGAAVVIELPVDEASTAPNRFRPPDFEESRMLTGHGPVARDLR
jgi:two-component system, NtrC family, sensor kinase